jgi:DHA1 family multidrug resistance protein-like MFS transporter
MDHGVPQPHERSDAVRQPSWRRNLYAVWLGELLAVAGFNAAWPFLPYYVQELGVTAPGQVELWTGLLSSVQSWTMAIASPIWGSLADRIGRKVMLARALLGGAVLLGLMACVSNVRQLLALRFVQGAVTGTIAAAYTLVSASAPADQRAYALGFVQMGVYVGASLGPAVGGFVADSWGYRASFVATATLLALGGALVVALVHESRADLLESRGDSLTDGLRLVVGSPGVLTVFAVRFLLSSGLRIANPMLPLFVQSLAPGRQGIASLTGLITSTRMVGTALGAVAAGRYATRVGVWRVLRLCLVAAAACHLLQAGAGDVRHLLILSALSGLALGGAVSALSAALAEAAPEGRQGTVFGLQSSVHSLANAVGPLLSGALAAGRGLRIPFLVAGVTFALASALLARRQTHRA